MDTSSVSSPLLSQTVTVYTRHRKCCPHTADKNYRKCRCPKWLYVYMGQGRGSDKRVSAKTASWDRAEKKAQEIRDSLDPVKQELKRLRQEERSKRITIEEASEKFLADQRQRNLAEATLTKTSTIQKQLRSWVSERNSRNLDEQEKLVYLDQLTTPMLTEWRATWRDKSVLSKRNKRERVRAFFRWCVEQDYLQKNPAIGLSKVVGADVAPTYPFSKEQFERLVDATYIYDRKKHARNESRMARRIRALILLMRWSGLSIMDAVTLPKARLLEDGTVQTYRQKTGVWVTVPLPPNVLEELHNVPSGLQSAHNPAYFFWSGTGSKRVAVNNFARSFRRVGELAKLKMFDDTGNAIKPHSHMLRDTFAVELLNAGTLLEHVSLLLGHRSIKITEKHYAPFVKSRQVMLTNVVRGTWERQGIRLGAVSTGVGGRKKYSATAS